MSTPDLNFHSYANASGLRVDGIVLHPERPEQYADIFKLSGVTDSIFLRLDVTAGDAKENACDINNLSRGVVIDDFVFAGGKQCSIVTKGGSEVSFRNGIIAPHTDSQYDVEIGGWSDQSMQRSHVELFNVVRGDGLPLRIVCGWWSLPKITGTTKADIIILRSAGYHAYNLGKYSLCAINLI